MVQYAIYQLRTKLAQAIIWANTEQCFMDPYVLSKLPTS